MHVHANEQDPKRELAGLRAATEATFFKLFVGEKHDVSPNEVHSRDPRFTDDMLTAFTELRPWFDAWWIEEEHERRADESPVDVATAALETYKASLH